MLKSLTNNEPLWLEIMALWVDLHIILWNLQIFLPICFANVWLSSLGPVALFLPNTFKLFGISNLSVLSVPGEGYSRYALCALNLISTF